MDYSNEKPSRKILYRLRSASQHWLHRKHRVSVCQKLPSYLAQQGLATSGISKSHDGRSFFHGVAVCGDPHACPVCREKIAMSRRDEIVKCLEWHSNQGGTSFLVTYTARHKLGDNLKWLYDNLALAKRNFTSWTAVKNARLLLDYSHSISARDTTYSNKNGWHPHYHDIWLVNAKFSTVSYFKSLSPKLQKFAISNGLTHKDSCLSLSKIRSFLASQWSKACVSVGLMQPSNKRGFDIQHKAYCGQSAVAKYLLKWAAELSFTHKKKASRGAVTPYEILIRLMNNSQTTDGLLWAEYVKAMFGRSLVYFSKGLKAAALINDETDSELAEKSEKSVYLDFVEGDLPAIAYYSAHGTLIDLCDRFESPDIAKAYLAHLREKYRTRNHVWFDHMKHLSNSIASNDSMLNEIQLLHDLGLVS